MLHVLKRTSLAMLAAGLLLAGSARADIIPTLPNTFVTPVSGGFVEFSYDATLTNDERLQPGNFFTIYDVPGLNSAMTIAAAPANWIATTLGTGVTPPRVLPIDDPTVLNVTYTYTGPSVGPGPLDLGTFNIITDALHGRTVAGNFTAEAIKASGDTAGTPVDNIGSVLIPAPGVGVFTPLPPAAFAVLPALLLAGFCGRRMVLARA